jgi:hypothetical protein
MTTPAQTAAELQKELTEALAQRAMIDEKVLALRNALQGVALGIEIQKAVAAEVNVPNG